MKILLNALIILFIGMLLDGCKENIVDNIQAKSNIIKRIIVNNENYTEYFYSNNLLIKKVQIMYGESVLLVNLNYDTNNRLIRIDELANIGIPVSTRLTFEYDSNNFMIRRNSFLQSIDSTYNYTGYTIYEYENKKITRWNYYNNNDVLTSYDILKYNKENIIEDIQYYVNDNSKITQIFEYDNKLNPLNKDVSFISAFTISKNNVTKWSSSYYTVSPPNIYIDESTYSYNDLGYPIKCTTVYYRNESGNQIQYKSSNKYEYY